MSNPLAQQRRPEFQSRISGTWGEFITARGRVSYLMTSARLGSDHPDDASRLARSLRPVREVLDVNSMSFSQLLQRDLDDYRVATELVPYLLKTENSASPAFFPPILAVLLPFNGGDEVPTFPAPSDPEQILDGGLPLNEVAYGDAFAVRQLVEDEANSQIRYGQLVWNEERSKLVVLDGQHRAMALLAIQRTVSNSWDDSGRGARYRNFYERRVRSLLEDVAVPLDDIRFPVTICWYPDAVAESNLAARQLFVDVNREARPPSPDRVVLLNDSSLLDIFTREFLDDLRAAGSRPPLYAIEYDRSRTAGLVSKWPSISSLRAVSYIIDYLIFGPEKYISLVDVPIRGSWGAAHSGDENMRERLRVKDYFPSEIAGPDGPFTREELGKEAFPTEARDELVDKFKESWGGAIRVLLAEISPYAVHYACLEKSREEWEQADQGGPDSLAREAVFGSGNLYWTLRTSALNWRDDPNAHEIRQAWARVEERGQDFREKRSLTVLGRADPNSVLLTDSVYQVLSTIACQLGLALTIGTLSQRNGVSGTRLTRFAGVISAAINAGLSSQATGYPRIVCLSQKIEPALNRISEMNAARAVEFRYLWLEVLCSNDSMSVLEAEGSVDLPTLRSLRDSARTHYFSYIVDDSVKRAVRYVSDAERSKVEIVTGARVFNELRTAVLRWFDVTEAELDEWASAATGSLREVADEEVDDDDGSGFFDEGS